MRPAEFKNNLKSIKNQLKGLTIQFVQPNSVIPYNSLMSFGSAVLDAEKYFNSFNVGHVWTSNGVIYPGSFIELQRLLKSSIVTGVSFNASRRPETLAEAIRMGGPLD